MLPKEFSQKVRVVLLEDSPEDAELIVDQLEHAGVNIVVTRVESEEEFSGALDEFNPDLILSDLTLPGYSGHQALALARQRAPLVPFIFVSGTIGEESAIQALREGAADYILKQNMARLAAAVERALREAKAELERRQAEAELLRVQRMESLALLTSGLGHDLRNVLQPLLIVPSIIRDHADKPQLLKIADLVNDCASRGLEMVASMLSFARGDGSQNDEVGIDSVFDALRLMLQANLPRNVEMRMEGMGQNMSLKANRTEIQQCLLNLALNGIQAMPDGGQLVISASTGDQGDLVLSVRDTGAGMSPEVREKLFTPFFTTKASGTGLGLHSCRRIVESHGGWIEVESTPGEGTRFDLHLHSTGAPSVDGDSDLDGRGENLLIVDENTGRANRTGRRLRARGYHTRIANDGASALQHIESAGLPDAVVIDTELSLLSAVQTLGELEHRGGKRPVLVLTATGTAPDRRDYPEELPLHFLAREAPLSDILRTLRVALDGSRAGARALS